MSRRETVCVWVVSVVFAFVFCLYSVERHNRFNSSALDLGIQDNVLCNTAHGRWFQSALETPNYLGDHVSLTLPFFSLAYLIREDVRVVLILQSLLLSLSAVVVAHLAARRIQSPWAGFCFALAFLLYPPLGFINRFDFHPVAAVIPLFLLAIYCFEIKRPVWGWVFVVLALFSKEQIGLVIAAWGLSLLVFDRNWKRGGAFLVLGLLWSYIALFHIIPAFRQGDSDTLARYSYLAETPGELLRVIFTQPLRFLQALVETEAKRAYLWQMLWPLAGLFFLAPQALLVALPVFAYNLLSSNVNQHSLFFQYNAPLIPWLFWAAVLGVERWHRWMENRSSSSVFYLKQLSLFVLPLLCLLIFVLHNPFTSKIQPPYYEVYGWEELPNDEQIREAIERIPPGASVTTTMAIFPHVSHREVVSLWWGGVWLESDYVLVNTFDRRWGIEPGEYETHIKRAVEDIGHQVVYCKAGVILCEHPRMRDDKTPEALRLLGRKGAVDLEFSRGRAQVLYADGRLTGVAEGESAQAARGQSRPVDFENRLEDAKPVVLLDSGFLHPEQVWDGLEEPAGVLDAYIDFEWSGRGLYLLDQLGRVEVYGEPEFFGDSRENQKDGLCVDLEIYPAQEPGYAILHSHGVVELFDGRSREKVEAPGFGWDIARAMVLTGPGSGYVLDGYGGLHSFGGTERMVCPGYSLKDRMVDLERDEDGRFWILRTDGSLHEAVAAP